jgi:hypothetical protein
MRYRTIWKGYLRPASFIKVLSLLISLTPWLSKVNQLSPCSLLLQHCSQLFTRAQRSSLVKRLDYDEAGSFYFPSGW